MPVNRQMLPGRSAVAWQMHLRVLALWAAGSVVVLALRVRPTMVPTTQARCYPSLPQRE